MASGSPGQTPSVAAPAACFACLRLRDSNTCNTSAEWLTSWHTLLRACQAITPLIEEHLAQRVLLLDLRGSEQLLLGSLNTAAPSSVGTSTTLWPQLAGALVQRLTSQQFLDLAVGIGPTRTLAWLASQRHSGHATGVILPDDGAAILADLPVSVLLKLPDASAMTSCAEIVAGLDVAGIRTLGQLQRVLTDALMRRFGADGAALAVLASGRDLRPFRPRVEESWLGARLVFDPPLLAHQVTVALGPLAERLALTLAQRELAAGKLAVVAESETGKRLQVERQLAHPLGTTRALLDVAERLLTGLLADSTAPAGEASETMPDVALPDDRERYSTLRLRVGGLHPATAEQWQLWTRGQQQAGAERIERLQAALRALRGGKHADALLQAEVHEPDAVLPEERYRLRPRSP